MGALHDAVLAAGTDKDRKRIKAQAWQSVSPDKDYQVTYRGHTITLTVTGSLTADAIIEKSQSGSFTADAIRLRTFYFGSGPDPR